MALFSEGQGGLFGVILLIPGCRERDINLECYPLVFLVFFYFVVSAWNRDLKNYLANECLAIEICAFGDFIGY